MDVDQEMLAEFVTESLQGLTGIEQDLLKLESDGGSDRELVNRVFRAVHSIKGTGSYMGLDNLVRLSHLAETLLDQIRSGSRDATAEVTDAILAAVDTLMEMLNSSDLGRTEARGEAFQKLESVLNGPSPEVQTQSTKASATADSNRKLAATEIHYSQFIAPEDLDLVADFINEGLQGLRDVEADLLSLETDGGTDTELVNRIFRAVHTIKGNGSHLKLENLIRVSHLAETLLDRVRCGQQAVHSKVTDAVLAAVDALTAMLLSTCLGASFDTAPVLAKLNSVLDPNSNVPGSAGNASGAEKADLAIVAKAWNGKFFVYAMRVDLEKLHSAIDLKEGVVAGLSSVGKILHASIPIASLDTTNTGNCTIYFETVLDPSILSEHLQVDAKNLVALDLKAEKTTATKAQSVSVPAKATSPTTTEHPKPTEAKVSTATTATAAPKVEAKKTPDAAQVPATPAANTKTNSDQTMRVPVHILHDLLEWTGTMVMARNQLMNEFNFTGNTAFRTLSQAISGVHETVIETRMQTTGSLFERYRRVVRDLARQLGKEVALHIEGGELELDRSILESFADPLTHLIRNCMDHALETPAEREATGKNRQGNVYLRSYVQSGEIILEVADDGRGISAERVCEKAVSKGVISADYASRLTEKEKVLLIFQAGFSTKDQATDVSGRGVGMDVVRNNIESVGGMIDVQTKVGHGSTFSAILPLAKALVSSSLTKALIVELHEQQFAIPETAISEIIRFDSRTTSAITRVDGQDVFQLRDKLIAIVNLEDALSLNASASNMGDQVSSQSSLRESSASCLVVFQYRKHFFGAVVDNVVGIQEIIVRSTPKMLQSCTVYSGHTVLGNGRVSLILDINGLVQTLNLKFMDAASKAGASKAAASNAAIDQSLSTTGVKKRVTQKMLIFSCADNEYFAIPLELVAIIERISPKDLRVVGQKEYCQLKQETVSIVRLDAFLPIGKFNDQRSDICLIRAAAVAYPIGILTGPDVSVVDVDDDFETRMNDSKGILGTFMHNDRLVMLLDLYSVFEQHAPDKIKTKEIEAKKARILVAEDSLFFRRLIDQYIRCEHWDVEIVNDGVEAWERLQNEPNRYQLVISDINMPRMDGFELATRVRDDRRFDLMPMVALTTLSEDHFREKGLSVGFDRYVVKIDKHQVRNTVAECLAIRRNGSK